MPKKIVFKSIHSSKIIVNNYLNNEKVEAIYVIETQLLKQKLLGWLKSNERFF
jgi:hypothetical protein